MKRIFLALVTILLSVSVYAAGVPACSDIEQFKTASHPSVERWTYDNASPEFIKTMGRKSLRQYYEQECTSNDHDRDAKNEALAHIVESHDKAVKSVKNFDEIAELEDYIEGWKVEDAKRKKAMVSCSAYKESKELLNTKQKTHDLIEAICTKDMTITASMKGGWVRDKILTIHVEDSKWSDSIPFDITLDGETGSFISLTGVEFNYGNQGKWFKTFVSRLSWAHMIYRKTPSEKIKDITNRISRTKDYIQETIDAPAMWKARWDAKVKYYGIDNPYGVMIMDTNVDVSWVPNKRLDGDSYVRNNIAELVDVATRLYPYTEKVLPQLDIALAKIEAGEKIGTLEHRRVKDMYKHIQSYHYARIEAVRAITRFDVSDLFQLSPRIDYDKYDKVFGKWRF